MKLLLGLLKDFDLNTALPYENLSTLDRLALLQLHDVWTTTRTAFSDFEFHRGVTAINRWVVADLSGFYFEAIKDICYCSSPSDPRRISACTTLHHIFSHLQNMLGPVTPLLVEESWEHTPNVYKELLQHPLKRVWEAAPEVWHNTRLQELLPVIMSVNSGVKAAQEMARSEKLLGQSLASEVELFMKPGIGVSEVSVETWMEILVTSNVRVVEVDNFEEATTAESAKISSSTWAHSAHVTDASGQMVGVAVVTSPTKEKCGRCWRYVAEPAGEKEVPICGRCTVAVEEFR